MSPLKPSRYSVPSLVLLIAVAGVLSAAAAPTSEWVYPGKDGKLVYKTTPAGDKIMDFSSAGYMGGGIALPDVPVKQTVKPSGTNDDTAAIQTAIDAVSAMKPDGKFRGAVLLAPGTFTCSRTINITTSGVVLRGSGSGEGGTTIKMTGARHAAVTIGGGRRQWTGDGTAVEDVEDANAAREQAAQTKPDTAQTTIIDDYVPSGGTTFTVADAKDFSVGDTINIRRPTTADWVKFMGMDTLNRNGRKQTWIALTRSENMERKITAIAGNKITINIPLSDSFDAKFLNPPGVTVSKSKPQLRVTQVGVEKLHLQCPPAEIAYGQAPYSAVRVGGDDCWVRDVYCEETMNSTVLSGKRITMEQVVVKHTYPNLGASKPTDFSIEGSQILIDRCKITGDNMYFVWTAGLYPGPNVILNCTFNGRGSRIQPHMRWSTGVLVDNCKTPDGGIDFPNRGVTGSGHGWTMGWAVAWNCFAKFYVIQNPPGAANWAIGCVGDRIQEARYFDSAPILPEGNFDSHGTHVAPQSLYLAQLQERLGKKALQNVGYAANSEKELTDKTLHRLPPYPADVDKDLGPDLALHRPINGGGGGRGGGGSREFAGEKAVDGDPKTYWLVPEGGRGGNIEADMEGPVDINAIAIEEADGAAGHVQGYRVTAQVDSGYKTLCEGTTIDGRKVEHFPKVTAWKVDLIILNSTGPAEIRKFGVYLDKSAEK
jgi:hypothetical protein